jgi:2-(1,2-epoxy-1,2-dihydrophenyl)acetyl-CoA isomerase
MYNTIKYELKDGVGTITFNRPDRYNAFNEEMSAEFMEALKECKRNPDVRVIVITGEGKAFCSGQDLKDVQGKTRSLADSVERRYNPMIRMVTGIEKPVICRMNGVAAGAGASLALACDHTIAVEGSSMVWAFVNIGLVLDSGSSYFLPRLVGRQKAFELATLGDKVSAADAFSLGLLNKVVPADQLDAAVAEVAARYAKGATKAIGLMKRMLNRSFESSLDEMLEQEKFGQEIAGRSEDYKEGVNAFVEKRLAQFQGK